MGVVVGFLVLGGGMPVLLWVVVVGERWLLGWWLHGGGDSRGASFEGIEGMTD